MEPRTAFSEAFGAPRALIGMVHVGALPGSPAAHFSVERLMKTHVIPGTPFTYWNIMQCWGALYGAMTILFGALLLVSRRASGGSPAVRRATAITAVIAALVQTACSFFYNAIPPVFFMIPAALLMLLAATWREQPTA